MLPLDLNLASRPFKNNAPLWIVLVLSAVALGAFSVRNVTTYRAYARKLVDLSERVDQVEAQRLELEQREREVRHAAEKLDVAGISAKTDKANEVIRWKAFSWTRLFNLLQNVQPNNVQMTSIRPIFRATGEVRGRRESIVDPEVVPVSVEGTARTLVDFLAFEKALFDNPHFDRPEPENTDTDAVTRETVFRLRFWYDPRVATTAADHPAGEREAPAEEVAEGSAAEPAPAQALPASVAPAPVGAAPVVTSRPAAPDPGAPDRPRKPGPGRRKRGNYDTVVPQPNAPPQDPGPGANR